jgi:hypothetical protein
MRLVAHVCVFAEQRTFKYALVFTVLGFIDFLAFSFQEVFLCIGLLLAAGRLTAFLLHGIPRALHLNAFTPLTFTTS